MSEAKPQMKVAFLAANGAEWLSYERIHEKFGLCKNTARSRVNEIRKECGTGKRYKRQSIIEDGKVLLINEYVFLDWLSVRKQWLDSNLKKYVEPFRADVWAELSGKRLIALREESIA